MAKSLTTKTAKKDRKRAVESKQIRDLKKKTGLDAKTLRKLFQSQEEQKSQKLRGIKRKVKERKGKS